MRTWYVALFILILQVSSMEAQKFTGYFDFTYDDESGKVTLEIPAGQLGKEFLYMPSLSAGIGSNDIGLDRGQLGDERVVQLERYGNKILMIQPNLDYRAVSDNPLERRSVQEAFAKSVLWGFDILDGSEEGVYRVDMTSFLLRDVHGVAQSLQSSKQGQYSLDRSRSVVNPQRTRAFPKNIEFDVILTFTGNADGGWISSVTPTPDVVTVQQHHSFIELPDDNYERRAFHPYAGYFPLSYFDYATPIESPISKKWITRHRLEKKNPSAAVSEAVEPIVYYLDNGCPEPIRSALLDGAGWWDQAFQAAGYAPHTFQVKMLPADADPMDVRYNVIQWVHRSTRGWSYGASVVDPRTGEILKGHVSLGSLRVRQDFMIAQGILSPYQSTDDNHQTMLDMAMARLRQLSAHEVGHTIGLAHNFATSTYDRASVMDYPHPNIQLTNDGKLDFSDAYDTSIGDWDKVAITYGYQDFSADVDQTKALEEILYEAQKKGYTFISDSDARPLGGAHPEAHLWDNGEDISAELNRMMTLRTNALRRLGENSITTGTPLSELEKVLVPVYLMPRYQMEAAAKLIGGVAYGYFVKGDAYAHEVKPVALADQAMAIKSVLHTLHARQLAIPQSLLDILPPPAFGHPRDRETFGSRTNLVFDPLVPAESYANMVCRLLLHKDRLTRIHRNHIVFNHGLTLDQYLNKVTDVVYSQQSVDPYHKALEQVVKYTLTNHLIHSAHATSMDPIVASEVISSLKKIQKKYTNGDSAFDQYLDELIDVGLKDPDAVVLPELKTLPPGSPIGCGVEH